MGAYDGNELKRQIPNSRLSISRRETISVGIGMQDDLEDELPIA